MVSVSDLRGGSIHHPLPSFQGIPIYADDFYPSAPETSVYSMALGRGGLYAVMPASFATHFVQVKEVLNSSNRQATYRVYWPTTLILERADALARLKFTPHPSTA